MSIKIDGGSYLTTTEIVDWLQSNPTIGLAATTRTVHYLIESGVLDKPAIRQSGVRGESLFPQTRSLLRLRELLDTPPYCRKVGRKKVYKPPEKQAGSNGGHKKFRLIKKLK